MNPLFMFFLQQYLRQLQMQQRPMQGPMAGIGLIKNPGQMANPASYAQGYNGALGTPFGWLGTYATPSLSLKPNQQNRQG